VRGFQCFEDSGEIEFADGINLIVGQNNSGKSALLRALQPVFSDDRHRTFEKWAGHELAAPTVDLVIKLRGDELRNGILRFGQQFIPLPQSTTIADYVADFYLESLWQQHSIQVSVTHGPGSDFTSSKYPCHDGFYFHPGRPIRTLVAIPNAGRVLGTIAENEQDSLPNLVSNLWAEDMFWFAPERFAVGACGNGYSTRLASNASNLPLVLQSIAGRQGDVFQKLVAHLRDIFSTVGNLSIAPTPDGQVEVRVWPTERMERVELSFPLSQSGTGVAQVIAILTAVMTVEEAVIVIDEINSFLHPAAAKALLRILQTEYAHHQYIISTHAPEVVSFSNARTLHLVKRDGYESSVARLDPADVDAFREVAGQLGVSMADVFAADRVVWVEGPTEELCFPLLYSESVGQALPRGLVFTSVSATGDFLKKRHKELVYEIYHKLSKVAGPLDVSVAFSFDSENLTEKDKKEMVRESQGAMHFLPRRMIECYLVNPQAIAEFVMQRDHEQSVLDAELVTAKLIELAGSDKYKIAEWTGDLAEPSWLAKVDGAKLISDCCGQISEYRVTFKKKDETLALLQRVLSTDRAQVEELLKYVEKLVKSLSDAVH
jgi:energy-coupling factor transporter ATP-binding protein EcfA2